MVSSEVAVQNSVGLHARPATFFIQRANDGVEHMGRKTKDV